MNPVTPAFNETEAIIKLLIAMACGMCIGLERENQLKSAGLRTHAIVALASALLMIISKYGFFDLLRIEGVRLDPSRIAYGTISGVAFLGAGTIFIRTATVRGLTTAAGVWTTCGVGMAIGAGQYMMGSVATLMIVLLNIISHSAIYRRQFPVARTIFVTVAREVTVDEIRQLLAKHDVEIVEISVTVDKDKKYSNFELNILFPGTSTFVEIVKVLRSYPELKAVSSTGPGI